MERYVELDVGLEASIALSITTDKAFAKPRSLPSQRRSAPLSKASRIASHAPASKYRRGACGCIASCI